MFFNLYARFLYLDLWMLPLGVRDTASFGGTPPCVGGPSLFRLVLSVVCGKKIYIKFRKNFIKGENFYFKMSDMILLRF